MTKSSHAPFAAGLLDLPAVEQEKIVEWCETPKRAKCASGFAFARQQLAAQNIEVSLRALQDFYSAWQLRRDVELARMVQETMQSAQPGSANTPREAAESLLLFLALTKRDATLLNAAVRSIDSRRSLEAAREKVAVLAAEKILEVARDPKTHEIAEETKMSRAEKIAAIRKAFFADVEAEVVNLPPRPNDLLPP